MSKFKRGHKINFRHGHATPGRVSSTYRTWVAMTTRCNVPTDKDYPDYGGRGITICPEWRDFLGFLADMGERPKGMTLDREDNDKGYYKVNCRWATDTQQHQNTRANVRITYQGETRCISDWERHLGMGKNSIGQRLRYGWSIDRALTSPPAR